MKWARIVVRLEIPNDEDEPAAVIAVRPVRQPARRIHRVLHGMDGGRPAVAVGECDQALHAQQILAVLAGQPAQRHGELEPGHRPLQAEQSERDAVGMDRLGAPAAAAAGPWVHRRTAAAAASIAAPSTSRAIGLSAASCASRSRCRRRQIRLGEHAAGRHWPPARSPRESAPGSPRRRSYRSSSRPGRDAATPRERRRPRACREWAPDRPGRWSPAQCAGTAAVRCRAGDRPADRACRPGPGGRHSRYSRWAGRRSPPIPPRAAGGRGRPRRTR